MEPLLVASDIGGTFTDTVTIEADGTIRRYKAPTVPDDPAAGVLATLEFAAADSAAELSDLLGRVSLFAHGTTVATNAMLESKTAVVGLIQTRGFGDTLSIMRGFKSLGLDEDQVKNFRSMVKQELVVPKRLTREVSERVDYRGRVVPPLDEDDARRAIRELRDEGVEVFAVSLLWAFKNPDHEQRLGELIAEADPDALFTLSSELLPRLGEYRRTVTTAINASLRPVLRTAVRSLRDQAARPGHDRRAAADAVKRRTGPRGRDRPGGRLDGDVGPGRRRRRLPVLRRAARQRQHRRHRHGRDELRGGARPQRARAHRQLDVGRAP